MPRTATDNSQPTSTKDDVQRGSGTVLSRRLEVIRFRAAWTAQRYYVQSLRLANEADDRALAGFTLRAMAHQAVDLGHSQQALQLAESALEWSRGRATPAATALFTILTARGHAATGGAKRTTAAIAAAEGNLSKAMPDGEPVWIDQHGPELVGLSCLTDGVDQIFAQAVIDLGGSLDVVVTGAQVPRSASSDSWPTYDELLSKAAQVHELDFIESTVR